MRMCDLRAHLSEREPELRAALSSQVRTLPAEEVAALSAVYQPPRRPGREMKPFRREERPPRINRAHPVADDLR